MNFVRKIKVCLISVAFMAVSFTSGGCAGSTPNEGIDHATEKTAGEPIKKITVEADYQEPETENAADVQDTEQGIEHDTEQYDVESEFYISEIPDDIFNLMSGKSYKDDCAVLREELRYVHVLHVGFDKKTHEGELVCNRAIAQDILDIFRELYDAGYEIEKIRLIDYYDADDEKSMSDNNTSCFNYRTVSGSNTISKHGLGMAIDINPLYNPYIRTSGTETVIGPANGEPYADRDAVFEHKIDVNDMCFNAFARRGFVWGGTWNSVKDYQHFEMTK